MLLSPPNPRLLEWVFDLLLEGTKKKKMKTSKADNKRMGRGSGREKRGRREKGVQRFGARKERWVRVPLIHYKIVVSLDDLLEHVNGLMLAVNSESNQLSQQDLDLTNSVNLFTGREREMGGGVGDQISSQGHGPRRNYTLLYLQVIGELRESQKSQRLSHHLREQ